MGKDYPTSTSKELRPDFVVPPPLELWYGKNEEDIEEFEKQMRRKVHYVIKPQYLWRNITELARTQNGKLLETLQEGFRYIENESFESLSRIVFRN